MHVTLLQQLESRLTWADPPRFPGFNQRTIQQRQTLPHRLVIRKAGKIADKQGPITTPRVEPDQGLAQALAHFLGLLRLLQDRELADAFTPG